MRLCSISSSRLNTLTHANERIHANGHYTFSVPSLLWFSIVWTCSDTIDVFPMLSYLFACTPGYVGFNMSLAYAVKINCLYMPNITYASYLAIHSNSNVTSSTLKNLLYDQESHPHLIWVAFSRSAAKPALSSTRCRICLAFSLIPLPLSFSPSINWNLVKLLNSNGLFCTSLATHSGPCRIK